MIDLFEKYTFINGIETLAFEYSDYRIFYKFRLKLSDNSILKIEETISATQRFYSFHWQNQHNNRFTDGTPHHPFLDNFPYHVHINNNEPIASKDMLIEDVKDFIKEKIQ